MDSTLQEAGPRATEEVSSAEDGVGRRVYVFPATYAQRSLWILNQLAPESSFYNVHTGVRIASALSENALARSLNEVVRRHESLRTTFKAVDGAPVQVVAASLEIDLPVIDLRSMEVTEREEEAYRLATEQALEPFNLERWPLLRSCLIRLADEEYIHVLTIHHIVCDDWSLNILLGELSTLYEAYCRDRPSSLPELEIQCADYAEWEWRWLQSPSAAAHLEYWRNQLTDVPALQLPTDWPRPVVSSFMGGAHYFTLKEPLYRALTDLSLQTNATLFMTVLAAFQTLLHRYTGQVDIAVGAPAANRSRFEIEGLIGHFVNSVVLRSDLSGDPTFLELVARVRNIAIDAYAHEDFPFEKLVHELIPERGVGHNPFFQVHFQLLSAAEDEVSDEAVPPDPLNGEPFDAESGTAKMDLAVDLYEYPDGIEGYIEYSTDLFTEETIARLADHFQILLQGIVDDPGRRLSELPLLSRHERQQMLYEWNATDTQDTRDQCLHQLFEDQVARTPAAIAARFDSGDLTYDALNRRANQLARNLQNLGVGPEVIVAIQVERSLSMIVALLAILKAGGAYLPLDPAEPKERLLRILQEAQPLLLLTQRQPMDHRGAPSLLQLPLEALLEDSAGYDDANVSQSVNAGNLAYVIYTSGSTGNPKGVMVESRAVCNHMRWMQSRFPLSEADRILMKYPFNFDASICEIFGPLVAGAKLIITVPSDHWDVGQFMQLLIDERVTVLDVVPSMLEALLDEGGLSSCRFLRRFTSGGETLSAELRDRFFAQMDAELHNVYGPTEATIGAAFWTCRPEDEDDVVPIGRPGNNMQLYILDGYLNPVAVGVPGEIYIGGEGVARGYLNQPGLTAEKFLRNPFSARDNARMYKTGDLARYMPDGNIEYLGRSDDQVKVRGYRIEPGEIEKAIVQHPAVRACMVVPMDGGGHTRLAACIVPVHRKPEFWPSLGEYEVYDELLYYAMTHDEVRNQAYRAAIRQSVAGKVVVDIGTGADAILARFCVEAGACRVYAIEADAKAHDAARKLLGDLALADRITLLHGDSNRVRLPEPVDVCVSEILGTIGSSEGTISVLNDARRFLKEDGIMIPRQCVTLFAPVCLPQNLADSPRLGDLPRAYVERVFKKAGHPFDLRLCIKDFPRSHLLAPPRMFEALDFTDVVPAEHTFQTRFVVERESRLHGFLFWLRLSPGTDNCIDSLDGNLSWLPVFFPVFYPGQHVAPGDIVEVCCSRRLASDPIMPDYTVSGALLGKDCAPIAFDHRSPRRTTGFRQHRFYEVLFAGAADHDPFETGDDPATLDPRPVPDSVAGGLIPDVRRFLKERLPHYMVPSSFVVMDELPMTASGKVDRGAVMALAQGRPELKADYLAPRNDVESTLAGIWSELLGIERIGVQDNFFELGGDSILSIQIIARANQAGLTLRPAQLFQYQTIAELAAVADLSPAVQADQRTLTGSVPLTPIQQWFFDQDFPDPHHYNHSLLVQAPLSVDRAKLALALDRVVEHHDALRLRFERVGPAWRQRHADVAAVPLEYLDVSALPPADQELALEKETVRIQAGLNLETGPLLRALLIDAGGARTFLFLVVHHLVIDGVSWRILSEDLWDAYEQLAAGGDIQLPPKTMSFQAWSRHLTEYAQSAALAQEAAYWESLARGGTRRLPMDSPHGDNTVASTREVVVKLNADETRTLLQDVPKVFHTHINEVLLTALVQAVNLWTGEDSLLIDLEGHGREAVAGGSDVSRTIGWFTSVTPVLLELKDAADPGEALRSVKEQLRQVPNHGIGFGALRHLSNDAGMRAAMNAIPTPDISFNYMGQYGSEAFDSPLARRFAERCGPAISQRAHRPNLIEINGCVSQGRLQMAWAYSENLHLRTTMDELARRFIEELKVLLAHCARPDVGSYTPSDFSAARLTQQDLDRLISKLQ